MIRSMTAFATLQGHADGASWTWDVRSVNGRGLDIKVRVPDGIDGLEAKVRAAVTKAATRGNVTIGLRLAREQADGALQIDPARLDLILEALDAIQDRAFDKGVTLGQPTAADVLAHRGVLVAAQTDINVDFAAPVWADFEAALNAMIEMREVEGGSLLSVITAQVDQIETLTAQAVEAAKSRSEAIKIQMAKALGRIMEDATGADPDRVAQELALIAVKSDITEEIDRLGAHVHAARDLLAAGGPCGRKLDFLTQEFNREANTLCSKAQDVALTQIGLALKAVIDQLREQVQNVE
ncbi:YicC/YloC family endoribonuclease [Octadecabacter sp. 1_MG-2023]|uniref:YicC/YloC family endoribonuclease n=1 Tax=unclassified Octadecabacter TaxID=196158 RepID=UPI0026E4262F|nr:YicC/YloC family endoribonuclease [Octadecabacter sp. 1_MG-2023]MDO6733248.1 YicC/YloC family endoribonuclease [Octadecabacter sp. 1_MG-2023]